MFKPLADFNLWVDRPGFGYRLRQVAFRTIPLCVGPFVWYAYLIYRMSLPGVWLIGFHFDWITPILVLGVMPFSVIWVVFCCWLFDYPAPPDERRGEFLPDDPMPVSSQERELSRVD